MQTRASYTDPEAVIAHLTGAGYARCEPPILQSASIFFGSGEDLRGQLYLTSVLSGADHCLRPAAIYCSAPNSSAPPRTAPIT